MPNVKELESLVDDTRWNPAIDTTKFPNVAAGAAYWSSTTDSKDPRNAWHVPFYSGGVFNTRKIVERHVRCVRGGQYGGSFGGVASSPVDFGFGTVEPGGESAPTTFTVTNTGTADMTITSIGKTDINPDDFRLQNDLCTGNSLAPSDTCTFEAVFAPLGLGDKEATLIVAAGTDAAAIATLTGTGVDSTPPTGAILIDNGAAFTTTTAVTLNLSATDSGGSGLGTMRLRNGGVTAWSAWEPFQIAKSWTLTDGAGKKTVQIQYRDNAGNISDSNPVMAGPQPYRDTIAYDPTAPTGSILINNGAATTDTMAVTLNLSAADTGGSGLRSMQFRNGGVTVWSAWEPYQVTRAWTLTSGAGNKIVNVRFKDKAGNVSDRDPVTPGAQPFFDTIQYTGP